MDNITSFRDLEVWQLAMDLVDRVIADTRRMPRVEFDLKRQIRRAVISIPSNIAEGWRRKRRRAAYQNHVSIAMGSEGELETELEIRYFEIPARDAIPSRIVIPSSIAIPSIVASFPV